MSTLAGYDAGISLPYAVAADSAGNVYVADSFNYTVRKINSAGVVTTLGGLAGNTGRTRWYGQRSAI